MTRTIETATAIDDALPHTPQDRAVGQPNVRDEAVYAARLVEEYWHPPNDWEASPLDDPAQPENWWWWLKTTWLKHRHTAVEVHPLLLSLQDTRGKAFMTSAHVVDVLDAKDPAALVAAWIEAVPVHRTRSIGLPTRRCAWTEGGEACDEPVRARNGKFCETHSAMSARRSKRHWKRGRGRKSSPSLAHAK